MQTPLLPPTTTTTTTTTPPSQSAQRNQSRSRAEELVNLDTDGAFTPSDADILDDSPDVPTTFSSTGEKPPQRGALQEQALLTPKVMAPPPTRQPLIPEPKPPVVSRDKSKPTERRAVLSRAATQFRTFISSLSHTPASIPGPVSGSLSQLSGVETMIGMQGKLEAALMKHIKNMPKEVCATIAAYTLISMAENFKHYSGEWGLRSNKRFFDFMKGQLLELAMPQNKEAYMKILYDAFKQLAQVDLRTTAATEITWTDSEMEASRIGIPFWQGVFKDVEANYQAD